MLRVLMVEAVLWKPEIILSGLGEQKNPDISNIKIEMPQQDHDDEKLDLVAPAMSEDKKQRVAL